MELSIRGCARLDATKGARWMPRDKWPMKGALAAKRLGEPPKALIRGYPNGETWPG